MTAPRPLVLVTGATGKTGAAVVTHLLSQQWPVRALVHGLDVRSERLRAAGAQVVVADLFDTESLFGAMKGVRRAYYCPPWHPQLLQSAVSFAVAARESKLEAIVGLSQWLASPSHPSLATRQNWLIEKLFAMVPGAAHVTVNPGFFADNYLRLIGFAAQLGLFPMPLGAGRNAPPSNEDIARVVAAALIDPERHAGRRYRPTGPELLSAGQMTEVLSRVLRRRVRHLELPMWLFLKALRALGVDPFQQTGLRHYLEEHRRGSFELGAPTDDVREVTGRAPEAFETIAGRYAQHPEAQRTVANTLRSLLDFARIGLTPAHDLASFERVQQHPFPGQPVLAIDSTRWNDEHEPRTTPAA